MEAGIVELDSNGASDDEAVLISPGNKNELLLGASEVDKLVDCSITASGERSDVTFSFFVTAVTPFTACCSDGSPKLVLLMVSISLLLPDDGVDTVTLILAVVPSAVDKFVLIDFSVEVEFIAADAAVIFNACCSGIDVKFSVLF